MDVTFDGKKCGALLQLSGYSLESRDIAFILDDDMYKKLDDGKMKNFANCHILTRVDMPFLGKDCLCSNNGTFFPIDAGDLEFTDAVLRKQPLHIQAHTAHYVTTLQDCAIYQLPMPLVDGRFTAVPCSTNIWKRGFRAQPEPGAERAAALAITYNGMGFGVSCDTFIRHHSQMISADGRIGLPDDLGIIRDVDHGNPLRALNCIDIDPCDGKILFNKSKIQCRPYEDSQTDPYEIYFIVSWQGSIMFALRVVIKAVVKKEYVRDPYDLLAHNDKRGGQSRSKRTRTRESDDQLGDRSRRSKRLAALPTFSFFEPELDSELDSLLMHFQPDQNDVSDTVHVQPDQDDVSDTVVRDANAESHTSIFQALRDNLGDRTYADILEYFSTVEDDLPGSDPRSFKNGMLIYEKLTPSMQLDLSNESQIDYAFKRQMTMYRNREFLIGLGL